MIHYTVTVEILDINDMIKITRQVEKCLNRKINGKNLCLLSGVYGIYFLYKSEHYAKRARKKLESKCHKLAQFIVLRQETEL